MARNTVAESVIEAAIAEIPVPSDAQPPYYRVRAADEKIVAALLKAAEAEPGADFVVTINRKTL